MSKSSVTGLSLGMGGETSDGACPHRGQNSLEASCPVAKTTTSANSAAKKAILASSYKRSRFEKAVAIGILSRRLCLILWIRLERLATLRPETNGFAIRRSNAYKIDSSGVAFEMYSAYESVI